MMAGKPITASVTARSDLDQMPDTPNRRAHHRRAQSETFFRFPDIDDILLDNVVMTDFNLDLSDTPMVPLDSTAAATKSADSSSSGPAHSNPVPRPSPSPSGPTIPLRSLSVDSDFFNGLGLTYPGASLDCGDGSNPAAENKTVGRHRHSNSMDESITLLFEVDSAKKAMAPDRLAELALIDPKRAKRILANRQSASRSKERKIRYTNELEKKVQTLQSEATSLSAQVTMLQRDTGGLTQENKELKLRLQAMEKETHLRDALNEALREELQRLKIASGQVPVLNGNNYNRAPPTQFPSQSQAPHFGNQQMQHSQQQQQLRMRHSTTKDKSPPGQQQLSFMDCNQMG